MATRKIRNWWWVDFRYEFTRYRKKSPVNTKGGAQAYEAQLRERLARGESLDWHESQVKETTFETFAWEWFETYVKANNKPSEQRSKEHILRNHLLPRFGRLRLSQVSSRVIEEFKSGQVARGLASQTVNNQLNVLSRCLRCATEWGLLAQMPALKRLKVANGRLDYLSLDECMRLLRDEHDPVWRTMVLLALRTGMRLGELCGLRWEDVDLDRQVVAVSRAYVEGNWVTPKSYRVRHVPLPQDAANALAQIREVAGLVFRHGAEGEPITHSAARWHLTELCKRSAVRVVGWHTLRHTYASHLAMHDVPLYSIQRLLGHSSSAMTERYAHLAPSYLRAAVAVLDGGRSFPRTESWAPGGHQLAPSQVLPLLDGARPTPCRLSI